MVDLNFSNVESVIFYNKNVKDQLPHRLLKHYHLWTVGKRNPMLRSMARKAILDFLNNITDDDLQVIENVLGEEINLTKLDYSSVKNLAVPISDDVGSALCDIKENFYFSTFRDCDNLYITFWR